MNKTSFRVGDPVVADGLKGRVTAVYGGGAYYRVRFPLPSPYFNDEGAVFRAHEVSDGTGPAQAKPAPPPASNPLPKRDKPHWKN